MRLELITIILSLSALLNCNYLKSNTKMDRWKNEILQTEKEFCRMAKKSGIAEAFAFFADDDAVILRNNRLIRGKGSIAEIYRESNLENALLEWKPDFVYVSESGDLAYTYGKYQMSLTDINGHEKTSEGIFHTVWKRQDNGSWRFVWD